MTTPPKGQPSVKTVWIIALKASGVTDKVPYRLRHSFAAWALTIRIDPNKLVRLAELIQRA
jgi:integrase